MGSIIAVDPTDKYVLAEYIQTFPHRRKEQNMQL